MTNMIALLGVPTLALVVVVAAVSVVGTYLFLRANKNKKAAIDAAVDKFKKENGL